LFATCSSHAAISLIANQDIANNSTNYGTTYFTGVTVQAGDILVVAHSPNKNTTTNTITLSGIGSNTISSINSGSTGTTSAAWVFYSEISAAGTYDLVLDTSNSTKTVTQATSYFVLRPGAGEVLTIAATDASVAPTGSPVGSLALDFTMSPAVTDAYGIAAAAMNTSTFSGNPAGWTQEISGADKRRTFSNSDIDGASLSSTWTAAAPTDMALAGIVVSAIAVPEPGTLGLGLASLAGLSLRRRRK
jgi:hypothetical protein